MVAFLLLLMTTAQANRALDLAGVPDYSEVLSSSTSEDTFSVPKWACQFCGHTGAGLQRCGTCRQGVYCSSLCLADHHLPSCSRKR